MSQSDPFAPGPQPGDTTYAAYTPGPYQTQPSGFQAPAPQGGGLGLPVASLICALVALGLVLTPLHPLLSVAGTAIAIIGVICGHMAMGRPDGSRGRGLAIAALVFCYVAFVIGLLHLIGALLLGRLLLRRFGTGIQRGLIGSILSL